MKIALWVVLACIIGLCTFLLLLHAPQATVVPSAQIPTIAVSPTVASATSGALLSFITPSLPISWQPEKSATESYNGKSIVGKEQIGTVRYTSGYLRTLANTSYLKANGWIEDITSAADGPNGSQWGYTKTENDTKRVIIFGYTNLSFTPPPNQTTCPCEFTVKIFSGTL